MTIVASPSGGPVGKNQLVWHDEMFSGEIGQIGTQFDGLGHIGTRVGNEDIFYNGFKRSEFSKAYGLEKTVSRPVSPAAVSARSIPSSG